MTKKTICHNCAESYLAQQEIEVCREVFYDLTGDAKVWDPGPGAILDVGCGNSDASREIFPNQDITKIDRVEGLGQDIVADATESLPFRDRAFNIVFMKRMLCQLDYPEAVKAFEQCARVAGHFLFVCEPFKQPRERLQDARVALGLAPLPRPSSGGLGVPELAWRHKDEWELIVDKPVAAQYVVETRLMYEVRNGRMPTEGDTVLVPKPGMEARVTNRVSDSICDKLGFYRARVWRRRG